MDTYVIKNKWRPFTMQMCRVLHAEALPPFFFGVQFKFWHYLSAGWHLRAMQICMHSIHFDSV